MKITKIEIYKIRLQLVTPWRTAYGEDTFNEPILVKMYSGSNYGWGEASPLKYPTYSPDFANAVYDLSCNLIAPFLLGKDIDSGEDLQKKLSWIKGNPFAKGAFDQAWWDIFAKMQNKPLWQLIKGNSGQFTRGDAYGIQESLDVLLEKIEQSVKHNCARIKLKFAPGWDINMLRAVREHFPRLTLHIDCNSSYTLDDIEMFKAIDEFNLVMIEQPLAYDDLIDHSKLQRAIKTPICLDESLNSVSKAQKAIELKSCRYFNLKPGRVGGNTNLLKINQIAKKAGIPCWIGGMLESAVGLYHCFHMATLMNMKYPADIVRNLYMDNLGASLPIDSSCNVIIPNGSGIAFDPKVEALNKVCKNRITIGS